MQQAWKENLQEEKNQTPEEGQTENQTQPVEDEDKIRLRNEFTQARQREIELATQLAERDKKSILNLDYETQKKVVKKLYWLDNLEDVKAIHWENFYEIKEDNDEDEDRTSRLEKELKLLKYNQSKREIDWAIDEVKKDSSIYFEDESFEDKLRQEIRYISPDLDTKERVQRAFSILRNSDISESDKAYKSIRDKWTLSQADIETDNNTEEDEDIKKEFSSIFSRYK